MNSRITGWLLAAALGFSACGLKQETVAGGTTTETEALIIGTFKNPDGSPAAGARVRIRPVGYLPDHRADSAVYGDLVADAQGKISWAAKDSGLFDLEAALGDTLGTVIRNISPGKESRNLLGTLDTIGSVRANLLFPVPGTVYTLRAYGMERYEEADATGRFRISLPSGDYRLVITGNSSSVTPLVIDSAHVDRGKETLLDSLRFPRLDSALLGYWPLEEGSGETVGDLSGNGHSGAMKGAAWTTGKLGGGLKFTKGQGYVDLGAPAPDPFAFTADSEFTFAAWAKIGNLIPNRGVARRIVSKQKNGGYAMFLRIFPDGNPGFGYNLSKAAAKASAKTSATSRTAAGAAVGVRDLKAPVNVGDGAWHHLVGVAKQGRLWLYVDGKLKATALNDSLKTDTTYKDYDDHSPLLYPDPGLDGHLTLGCVLSGVDGFDGAIDEVRIYGRALFPEEILLLARPFTSP